MYGESNMEIYDTIYKGDSQWEFAVWLRELKQRLCNRLKDGMEREMGGDMGVPMADSCWCMTENHKVLLSNFFQLKKIFKYTNHLKAVSD